MTGDHAGCCRVDTLNVGNQYSARGVVPCLARPRSHATKFFFSLDRARNWSCHLLTRAVEPSMTSSILSLVWLSSSDAWYSVWYLLVMSSLSVRHLRKFF